MFSNSICTQISPIKDHFTKGDVQIPFCMKRNNLAKKLYQNIDKAQHLFIVGPPGVGKTRIAEQAISLMQKNQEAVHRLDVSQLKNQTKITETVQQVAAALVPLYKNKLHNIFEKMKNKNAILFIDDADQLPGMNLLSNFTSHEDFRIIATTTNLELPDQLIKENEGMQRRMNVVHISPMTMEESTSLIKERLLEELDFFSSVDFDEETRRIDSLAERLVNLAVGGDEGQRHLPSLVDHDYLTLLKLEGWKDLLKDLDEPIDNILNRAYYKNTEREHLGAARRQFEKGFFKKCFSERKKSLNSMAIQKGNLQVIQQPKKGSARFLEDFYSARNNIYCCDLETLQKETMNCTSSHYEAVLRKSLYRLSETSSELFITGITKKILESIGFCCYTGEKKSPPAINSLENLKELVMEQANPRLIKLNELAKEAEQVVREKASILLGKVTSSSTDYITLEAKRKLFFTWLYRIQLPIKILFTEEETPFDSVMHDSKIWTVVQVPPLSWNRAVDWLSQRYGIFDSVPALLYTLFSLSTLCENPCDVAAEFLDSLEKEESSTSIPSWDKRLFPFLKLKEVSIIKARFEELVEESKKFAPELAVCTKLLPKNQLLDLSTTQKIYKFITEKKQERFCLHLIVEEKHAHREFLANRIACFLNEGKCYRFDLPKHLMENAALAQQLFNEILNNVKPGDIVIQEDNPTFTKELLEKNVKVVCFRSSEQANKKSCSFLEGLLNWFVTHCLAQPSQIIEETIVCNRFSQKEQRWTLQELLGNPSTEIKKSLASLYHWSFPDIDTAFTNLKKDIHPNTLKSTSLEDLANQFYKQYRKELGVSLNEVKRRMNPPLWYRALWLISSIFHTLFVDPIRWGWRRFIRPPITQSCVL